MGIHLTVISYPQTIHPMFEAVALAANNQSSEHRFARCQNGGGLRLAIANSKPRGRDGRPDVSVLDLVGHGRAGYFKLGDEILIDNGKIRSGAVRELNDLLPRGATVRFLGCLTGDEDSGLQMFKEVVGALQQRIAVSTDVLQPWHFGQTGLLDDYRHLLLSSDAEETSPTQRHRNGVE
ncbi:DUF4347 domain-containing protein [Corallococcus exercitus]|uniref:DUF4347 domain-containing protein n=1 Tax=Corallococcus exercitus TaxID=2316736 RepID=A0A3A8IHC8_9BACT|nr:DUF4347 domain-containing protein [Corallococcus exercitus]NOK37611.1 DUF4347 domain-containing protein [Corallococcus exercitus]RKG79314.1 DUF4347 domain-containing protein [Corallococcus exercitus]